MRAQGNWQQARYPERFRKRWDDESGQSGVWIAGRCATELAWAPRQSPRPGARRGRGDEDEVTVERLPLAVFRG